MELPYIPPVSIFPSLESKYSILLESKKGPEKIARFSFIAIAPFMIYRVKDYKISLIDLEHNGFKTFLSQKRSHPLWYLREMMRRYRITRDVPSLPPFLGGAIGLVSYDFVHYLERLPRTTIDDLNIPDCDFLLVDTIIAFDHIKGKTFLITCPGARESLQKEEIRDPSTLYEIACERIERLYQHISSNIVPCGSFAIRTGKKVRDIEINHEMGKERYMDIVRRAKEYIRAGDIFQANLSQRISAPVEDTHPWNIYEILGQINPSPFSAYLNMGDYYIVSSSPERLIRVLGNVAETRPIAGTRPRGKDRAGDQAMREELLLNEKERAEHIMLIDLERNDLGKVSDYGTVCVDELMITEDYSHVIHIVSNIRGRLVRGRDCFDVIRAVFPGGTITGVPKVRCMEIIDELEPVSRGPYTGSIGYISFTGDMDLNIVIRTFVIKDCIAYVQAGAGIVADSDPEREYYETLKKAEALIRTLELI